MSVVAVVNKRHVSQIIKKTRSPYIVEIRKWIHRSQHNNKNPVRIGCASGFWGDTTIAAPQLVHHGKIDYLVFDYLSEITMSLLAKAKQKNPKHGFAPDFVYDAVGPLLSTIKEKGIKVITNAGGINPIACAQAMSDICKEKKIDMNIAVVTGDDLMDQLEKIKEGRLNTLPKNIQTMNAYLGAGPIARSLDLGADIVITGRCVDSAVTLGPLLHEFKWDLSDYDLLAAGSLAGHLIECGAQVTGGIFTDWELVHGWDEIGFPIIEIDKSGEFTVTKPPNTGGMVTHATISEQIVYEIGDPSNYHLPDVNCDFSLVKLESEFREPDSISVIGAIGKKPSDMYKVSATYMDGYRATAVCPVIGPYCVMKGERVANSIIKRCRKIFQSLGLNDFKRTNVEMLGSEGNYGSKRGNSFTKECVIWMAVEHEQKKALDIFAKEIAPAGTGMAPGLTNIVGGRPSVTPVLKFHSFMHPKSDVEIDIHMNGELLERYQEPKLRETPKHNCQEERKVVRSNLYGRRLRKGKCTFPLGALAYTRSGDKGNDANIGVICRNAGYYKILSEVLTTDSIKQYFLHYFEDIESCQVTRYDLPNIYAFNFILKDVLGGGGIASLRSDPQGKALGQMLLDFKVRNVPDLLPSTYDKSGNIYGL